MHFNGQKKFNRTFTYFLSIRMSLTRDKSPSTSTLSQIAQNNLMASAFDQSQPINFVNKFSNFSSYRHQLFEESNQSLPTAVLNSESRIPTWPWFYFNDVSNPTVASAAAMAFNKLNEKTDDTKMCDNSSILQGNQKKGSTMPSCTSKIEKEIVNNASLFRDIGCSDKRLGKADVLSSLASSPSGHLSSSSSPTLDDDGKNLNQEKDSSPLDLPRRIKKLHVIYEIIIFVNQIL